MTSPTAPTYPRAPSEQMEQLLLEGFLAPLLRVREREKSGCNLDVHLRPDNEVHVYCGLTRIAVAKRKGDGTIQVSAHDTYQTQGEPSKDLFRDWTAQEAGFEDALTRYLEHVEVADRYTAKEGRIQAAWSRVTWPWTPFDREAVLNYANEQEAEESRKFPQVESARSLLSTIAVARPGRGGKQWQEPASGGGSELDQLAVDDEGNLVLVEFKHAARGGNPSQIYYAPLQLLQYVHEWRRALGWLSVWRDLQNLIEARQKIGLTPQLPKLKLTGRIRGAICFGIDERSEEVKRRFYEALGIVNAHLPQGVRPIETWKFKEGGKPEAT